MIPIPMEQSYFRAEAVTAHWARSFYFASRFLPRDKKRAIFALYDYCRHADNLVDERGSRTAEEVREELAALGVMVRQMHAGIEPDDSRWLALYDTLQRYPVPLAPLLALLDGVACDLEPVAIADLPELLRYCHLVAGGVGLMLGPVLGAATTEYDDLGVGLGNAMQLTNVLRDVREDLDNGRCYLPADEMAAWGVSRADLEARRMTPALRAFLQFQVQRARRYFSAADPIVELFPDDGSRLTIRLLQQTYAGILTAIERQDYDVFQGRAHVPFRHKLLILGRAMLRQRRSRAELQHIVAS